MKRVIVIDVQGFRTPQFCPKEMSAFDGEHVCHYLFKPPFSFNRLEDNLKREVKWLENNKHGLRWSYGYTDLCEVRNIIHHLSENTDIIYCKGQMKAEYIQQFLVSKSSPKVVNLEEAPALMAAAPQCFFHNLKICNCTLTFVKQIYRAILSQHNNAL